MVGAEVTSVTEGSPVDALAFLPDVAYCEAFEGILREALERGHRVDVALDHDHNGLADDKQRVLDALCERYPTFAYQELPRRRGLWRIPASATRRSLDYLRYLDAGEEDADAARERARDLAPRALRALLVLPPFRWRFGQRSLRWLLGRLEAGMPIPGALKSLIRDRGPDVVLVAPLVDLGSNQGDCLRAAEAVRVPSVAVVPGTDALTAKGAIRDVPTLAVVGDEAQAEEAVRQGLPPHRVEAVGDAPSSNGLAAPDAPGTVEAIERAAPAEVVRTWRGRLLRPLLWLLTPLVALLLLLLRPRAIARLAIKAARRLRKRGRALRRDLSRRRKLKRAERTARRREASARAAIAQKERAQAAKEEARARAATAKEEQEARAREAKAREHAAKEDERARALAAKHEEGLQAREAKLKAKEDASRSVAAAGTFELSDPVRSGRSGRRKARRRPPIWRRKAVRGKAKAVRRRWKQTRRGVRRVYNRRYRWSYKRTIKRIPARDELPALLNARGLLGRGVEIGVKQGRYSEELLENWRGEELISIDPWLSADPDEYVDRSNVSQDEFERYYQETCERLRPYGSRSTIWRTTSVEAAPRVPDHSLDFVYIDARHDYESVKEDLEAWCSKVRPGGILAGHDYVDGDFPQGEFYVKSAVDEFFAELDIPVHGTEGPSAVELFPTWIVEVPEEGIPATPVAASGPDTSLPPARSDGPGTPEKAGEETPNEAEQASEQSPRVGDARP